MIFGVFFVGFCVGIAVTGAMFAWAGSREDARREKEWRRDIRTPTGDTGPDRTYPSTCD